MPKHFQNLTIERQGILLALLAMLTFSVFDSTIKYTLQNLDFAQVIFITYVFNILITGGMGIFQRKSFKPKHPGHVIAAVTLNVFEQLCFLTALKYLPFTELFVVILATPMLVLVFSSLFLKEHLHRYQIIAMTAGFLGAMFVAASPLMNDQATIAGKIAIAPEAAWIGWACAIGNVFFGAARTCYMRKFAKDENSLSLMMLLFIALLVISALRLPDIGWDINLITLIPLALGCIIGNLGLLAYLKSIKTIKAPLVAATQYSQIIWAILIGYFIFKEVPTLVGLVGSVLILLSGYFLYIRKHPAYPDEKPD